MEDQSHLDQKYFIDPKIYNCPFCNRRHVSYVIADWKQFHWTGEKSCYAYFIKCSSCQKTSMHLSYKFFIPRNQFGQIVGNSFGVDIDIDSEIFYSVPTSFFVVDQRIPREIRELITEADGCLKMNFLTGASACTRKAIYELTVMEKATGDDYESQIKLLKQKYPAVDASLFDILAHIQGMTSDKVHEQSWPHWDSDKLKFLSETLKAVLYEIYVLPKEKAERFTKIQELKLEF
jgi:transcription elongation factor Elf1